MTLQQLNTSTPQHIKEELFNCCGSTLWAEKLSDKIPFNTVEELRYESNKIWFSLDKMEWLEAFTHHPKIGDIKSLEQKFASTIQWASGEQSGVNTSAQNVLTELNTTTSQGLCGMY